MAILKIIDGKGIHLAFDNGVTLSVQIGGGNYCDNYDMPLRLEDQPRQMASTTAEIAFWIGSSGMLEFPDGDTVKGYVTMSDIFELIGKINSCDGTLESLKIIMQEDNNDTD